MGVIKACRNCGREKTITADGCCFVCYQAAKGLKGDEKEAALAAAKKRIESGGLRKNGASGRAKKAPTLTTPGNLLDTRMDFVAQEIPITIKLTIDVFLRLNGAA